MRTIPMAFAALALSALALASCSLRGASEISLIGSGGSSPDAGAGHGSCDGSGGSLDAGLDYDGGGYYGNDGGGYYGNDAGISYGDDAGSWEEPDAGLYSLDAGIGSGHHH